jgi:hypothetical protein
MLLTLNYSCTYKRNEKKNERTGMIAVLSSTCGNGLFSLGVVTTHNSPIEDR